MTYLSIWLIVAYVIPAIAAFILAITEAVVETDKITLRDLGAAVFISLIPFFNMIFAGFNIYEIARKSELGNITLWKRK